MKGFENNLVIQSHILNLYLYNITAALFPKTCLKVRSMTFETNTSFSVKCFNQFIDSTTWFFFPRRASLRRDLMNRWLYSDIRSPAQMTEYHDCVALCWE